MVENKSDDTITRFDTTHERDRHTHTETDRQTPHDGIGRPYGRRKQSKVCAAVFTGNVQLFRTTRIECVAGACEKVDSGFYLPWDGKMSISFRAE